jgi:hypothetical protein
VGAFAAWQNTRGGATFNVPVTSSEAATGTITNSPLVFSPNTNFRNAAFAPVAAGSTLVGITQPAGFTATTTANTNARTQFTANVTGPPAVVTITSADTTTTEAGRTTGTFTISRTGGNLAASLSVRFALSGTAALFTDFDWSPGASNFGGGIYGFSIPAGLSSITVTVTPDQDNLVEGTETIVLNLSPSSADPAAYAIGTPGAATLTITDDPPVVTLTAIDASSAEADLSTGTFVITRSGGNVAQALSVRVALAGTATLFTDFNWTPGGGNLGGGLYQFSIPAAQTLLTVTTTPIRDNLVEGAETLELDLSPSIATPANYTIGTPSSGTINIADDPPVVTLTVTDDTATEAGPTTGTFVLARSGGNPVAGLSVRVNVGGTATIFTDYALSPGGGNLGGGIYQWSFSGGVTSLPVTLTPVNDTSPEVDETATFTLSASTSTPPIYSIGSPSGGTITIVSDEKPTGPGSDAPPATVAPLPVVPVIGPAPADPSAAPAAAPTKADIKRQQRNERVQQRAAQKEAKRQAKRGAKVEATAPPPGG